MLKAAMTQGASSAILPLILFCAGFVMGLLHLLIGKKANWAKQVCLILVSIGLISQCITLLLRWIEGSHFPVVGLFEALFFFSFCLAVAFLYLSIKTKRIGPGSAGTVAMACLILLFYEEIMDGRDLYFLPVYHPGNMHLMDHAQNIFIVRGQY